MTEQQRFEHFIRELTSLSQRHGIVIQSTGGVHIFAATESLQGLAYSTDASSGDLTFTTKGA